MRRSVFIRPVILRPVYILRIILAILFYLVLAPIGLIMRLFRVDLLDRKIDKKKESYWRKKEEAVCDLASYERQF
ncbi:MAG: hypothetical protein PHQ57_00245 [Candidatus Omnitrophica bacterium]|nr:hypothetical protein [Candidatus Omnitrophota bacterium]